MSAPRVGLWIAIPLSLIAAPKVLVDAALRWSVARSMVYIHLVIMLAWIPLTGSAWSDLQRYAERHGEDVVATFPMILVTEGRLITDVPVPYSWVEPSSGRPLLVVDTSGEVRSLEGREERVLVAPGLIAWVEDDGTPRSVDTSSVPALLVDGQALGDWMQTGLRWFPLMHYALGVVMDVTSKGLLASFCGAGAASLARRRGWSLGVPGALGLGCVAVTPTLALELAQTFAGWRVPWGLPAVVAMALALWGSHQAGLQREE